MLIFYFEDTFMVIFTKNGNCLLSYWEGGLQIICNLADLSELRLQIANLSIW